MTDITIPERAIEAGARALRFNESSGMCELDRVCALCDCFDPKTSDGYARLHARKALESAAPHIAAQALRDAAAEVDGYAYTPDDVREVAHGSDYADGITDAHHVFDRLLNARADRIEADHG